MRVASFFTSQSGHMHRSFLPYSFGQSHPCTKEDSIGILFNERIIKEFKGICSPPQSLSCVLKEKRKQIW